VGAVEMRFGLLTRVILILTVALFATQLVALAFYFGFPTGSSKSSDASAGFARQVASLVRLVDEAPADLRPTILEAFTETGHAVSIVANPPGEGLMSPSLIRIEHGVRTALAVRGMADSDVRVRLDRRKDAGETDTFSIFVRLESGDYLWLDVKDGVTVRVLGVPIGFFAGLFGIVVAIIALLAVAREMRPLSRLARQVDRIGEHLNPTPIPEKGAPELHSLIRAVNAMQERIAALLRNRTLTLGAISHDLRTYLTRLRLRVEMMPKGAHKLGAIADVEAMQTLIEDTLDFAQGAFVPTEAEPADLAGLLRSYCTGHVQGGQIELDLPDRAVLVRLDEKALLRVCGNLIENAVRYGERALVRVECSADAVRLIVEDEGPGIAPEDHEQVFEPFFRLEASRNRESGGAGLGLTIVKRIVERHGGTVTLGETSRAGLKVTVTLPPG